MPKASASPGYVERYVFSDAVRNRLYYDLEVEIPPEIAASIPQDVELIYWDYYHGSPAVYDAMLGKHDRFSNPVQFVGGMWKWMGPPLLSAQV